MIFFHINIFTILIGFASFLCSLLVALKPISELKL